MDEGVILNQPLCIGDLLEQGAIFEINTDLDHNLDDDLFDDLNIENDSDHDDNKNDLPALVSPWDKPFNELRKIMKKIDDNIYKKIIKEGDENYGPVPDRAKCIISYDAFAENETYPYDSSNLRGKSFIFHCGRNEVLSGLECAVKTMYKGEKSQFVISYRLLLGELGCPPRVKPKADGLFIIKLIDFNDCGDANALNNIEQEDRNKYSIVIDKIKDIHLKGLDLFKNGNLQGACRIFHKAIEALEYCRLNDENEQNEQQKFLIKLYTNLSVCYNRLNNPKKTCLMCNEIRKLTNINNNCKALFQEGRALLMLGEFKRAKDKLLLAQNLEPQNNDIINELKLLNKKYEEYRNNEKIIWKKAMQIKCTNDNDDDKEKHKNNINYAFKDEIRKLLKNFAENEDNESKTLNLPDGLSTDEIKVFNELSKEFNLKFSLNDTCSLKRYVISKNNK